MVSIAAAKSTSPRSSAMLHSRAIPPRRAITPVFAECLAQPAGYIYEMSQWLSGAAKVHRAYRYKECVLADAWESEWGGERMLTDRACEHSQTTRVGRNVCGASKK